MICNPHRMRHYSGDHIKMRETSAAGDTYGGKREVYSGFCWGKVRKRDHLEDWA
jgi:hypothetical protein